MPDIQFDRFYRYDELSSLLHVYVEEYADLVTLESIGKSHEGRDIWLLAVTNRATGPIDEKPVYWVDGNIHSIEVTASTAVLYLLHTLVTRYGRDADITRCLDTRGFYLVPRVNPDGAEWALAERPHYVRSSTRAWPFTEEPGGDGLTIEDVDGDGRILTMRIRDANGPWKCHPQDSRLMVKRDPIESGGDYFRLLPEGKLEDWDGYTVQVNKSQQGLDLNRNFPANWRQEFQQLGAGPYPTSEPEIRALVDFVAKHPNICGGTSFHTFSGVLLRAFCDKADEAMPPEDLWVYRQVGEKGAELTGYPAISIYHDFRYHPKQVISGGFDWLYEHLGIFYWAVEIWSPMREAGIEKYDYIGWFRDHPIDDDLKLIRWSDEKLGSAGFVDWYAFEHPQLGKIELGGWNKFEAIANPPAARIESEVERFPRWLVYQALISPKLELAEASATRVGENTYRVRLVVQNTGHLPSYVTKQALEHEVVRGVIAEIELPEDGEIITGKARAEFAQLEGRAYKHTGLSFWPDYTPTDDRLKIEWVVRARAGMRVNVSARHERAGVVRTTLTL